MAVDHWLLLTASREWRDSRRMRYGLLKAQQRFPDQRLGLCHGDAAGGDKMAAGIATQLGWVLDPVPCTREQWGRYGRSAGHRRNKAMVDRHDYVGCLAFPWGLSAGTRGCMVLASDAGIPVWNLGEPAIPDGLYRVQDGATCAGFVVRSGVVIDCAPILRAQMDHWWRAVTRGSSNVIRLDLGSVDLIMGA